MNAQSPNLPAERRAQVVAGGPVAALVPQSLEEAYRLANAIAASGMAPQSMARPEQVLIAILAGAEVGLAPWQAVQSIAVIGNRPSMWGDGLMAVVRQHGVKVREWLDGEGDEMVAHCEVTRPDTGEQIERSYSVDDAKLAKLWGKTSRDGKPSPWVTSPKRMLQMRARAFALRDGCADMLRGMHMREEVEDYQTVRDVTPRPSGLRERLTGSPGDEGFNAHHAPAEPVDFAEQAEEVAEADFTPADEVETEGSAEIGHLDQQLLATEPLDGAGGFASTATQRPDDDPLSWAAGVNQRLDGFKTLERLNAFTDDPTSIARFEQLQAEHPNMAKSLAAAITGRRKALASLQE